MLKLKGCFGGLKYAWDGENLLNSLEIKMHHVQISKIFCWKYIKNSREIVK